MKISDRASDRIFNLSVLCMLLVIVQHIPLGPLFTDHIGIFTGLAVPVFFMISGFFFVSHAESSSWWWDGLRKRVHTLLIPYLVANVLWYLADSALSGRAVGIRGFCVGLGLDLSERPADGPLWYMRGLMIFMVLAGPLYGLIRRAKGMAVSVVLILLLGAMACRQVAATTASEDLAEFLKYGFNVQGLFCFTVGMVISRYEMKIKVPSTGHFLFLLLAVLSLAVYFIGGFRRIDGLMVVAMMAVAYLLWAVMPRAGARNVFKRNLFAVYLYHAPVIAGVQYAYKAFVRSDSGMSTVEWMVLNGVEFLLCIGFPILVSEALKRWRPNVARVCFGGR